MTQSWRHLQQERFQADPAAKARWDSLALARAVANTLVEYRAEHQLSQRALAYVLSMSQSQVARLELGEHNPSIETLGRLAQVLGCRIVLTLEPAGTPPPEAPLKVLATIDLAGGGRLTAATA